MAFRLAVVLSHPTQYYSPWFRWLRASTSLNFRVFYLWDAGVKATYDPQFQQTFAWDVDLVSGYDHEFVVNTAGDPGTHHFGGLRNPELLARLADYQPAAMLLFGYKSPSHLRAIAWARSRSLPIIFRGDSHLLGRTRLAVPAYLALRLLYSQFAAFVYVGEANRDYFTALGVRSEKLFFAPHAVDPVLFDSTNQEHKSRASLLRQELGIKPSTRVLIYVGKLTATKQPGALLAAFTAMRVPNTALIFVGDGEEKSSLLEQAEREKTDNVHFLPFTNQREIPSRYLAADIFVLPSRGNYETWGLAVNEAMQMGLPCLVSDLVGCQRDLVTDDETGWVFRAYDAAHLKERLRTALTVDLDVFKPRVVERIANYSYAAATAGLLQGIRIANGRATEETIA